MLFALPRNTQQTADMLNLPRPVLENGKPAMLFAPPWLQFGNRRPARKWQAHVSYTCGRKPGLGPLPVVSWFPNANRR